MMDAEHYRELACRDNDACELVLPDGTCEAMHGAGECAIWNFCVELARKDKENEKLREEKESLLHGKNPLCEKCANRASLRYLHISHWPCTLCRWEHKSQYVPDDDEKKTGVDHS